MSSTDSPQQVNVLESDKEVKSVVADNERTKKDEDLSKPEANESLHQTRIPNGTTPGKMTLQLVLPNNVTEDPSGYERIRPRSRPISRTGSVIESKSPGFINTRLVNYNRGLSYQPSVRSQSHFQPEPVNIPPPSSEEEKAKTTKRYFATVSAISYAIFLVIFGAIVFVGTAVETEVDFHPAAEVFCIFMLSVGFCYFLFLLIDIRMHIKKAKKAVKDKEARIRMMQEHIARTEEHLHNSLEYSNNNINLQIPLPNLAPVQPLPHRYCFASGRHGEFLYLKLGAAWFAFGLLTHSILTLTYQVVYFAQESECGNILLLTVEIMFPLYSLFVLFFIFKYCNVIINSYVGIGRLMFCHAIGTSLAFWIYTIVRETQDAINMKNNYSKMKNNGTGFDFVSKVSIVNHENKELFTPDCPGPEDLNLIYRNFAPYLYPFIIEYCILIVGIFYMIWANINHCPKKLSASGHGHDNHNNHGHSMESNLYPSLGPIAEESHLPNGALAHSHPPPPSESDHCKTLVEHDNQYKSNLVVYADCHAASRGLFVGMVLMIITIVFIILFHVAVHEPNYRDTGILIDRSFELGVLVLLTITTIAAYFQTSKLDINHHPMSKLDDVLLFIAIPAFFSETIFSMVPAIINGSTLNICIILAQLIQIMIQTPWIIDSLRRCSNSEQLRKKKPGRELVTFMTIANVSLWIFYTFSVKNADVQDERYSFYGDVLWSILNHLSLPLIMFYRFHASVCLVDIWRHSYEPGEFAH